MPDPLTLTCFCGEGEGLSICTPVALTFIVDYATASTGHSGLSGVSLRNGTEGVTFNFFNTGESGRFELPVSLDLLADWDDLNVLWQMGASVLQLYATGVAAMATAQWRLVIDYLCVNVEEGSSVVTSITAVPTTGEHNTCDIEGITRFRAITNGGSGTAFVYNSSPLSPCQGAEAVAGLFAPDPADDAIQLDNNNELCLCAEGGTPPYTFSVETGTLPCGLHLNAFTGCLEGETTGECDPTGVVTFRVTDRDGNFAETDCTLITPCDCSAGNEFR